MVEWVLVVHVFAGSFSKSDSVALASIGGFSSQRQCEQAAAKLPTLVKGTVKELRYICISRGGQ